MDLRGENTISVSTWQKLESSEKKEPELRKFLHEIQLKDIFSVSDRGERAQACVGDVIPGLVVLGFMRRQAE